MRAAMATLLVLATGSCAARAEPKPGCDSPTDRSPALGASFNLRYGGTATVAGEHLSLTFEKIDGDSRCPVGVTCIWEGNARVVVKAERPPAGPAAIELNTSARDAAKVAYQGYDIQLLDVLPHPEHGRALEASGYCLALKVVRVLP